MPDDGPKQNVEIARAASEHHPHEAEAVGLPVDAAALLAVSCGTPLPEIAGRLEHSFAVMEAGQQAARLGTKGDLN